MSKFTEAQDKDALDYEIFLDAQSIDEAIMQEKRKSFRAGFLRAIKLLYIRYEDKYKPPVHPASARVWGNWLKTFIDKND